MNDEGKIMGLASAKASSIKEIRSIKAISENQLATVKADYILKKCQWKLMILRNQNYRINFLRN